MAQMETEGEKAFVDDRENGKRKSEEGEHVLLTCRRDYTLAEQG